MGSLDQTWVTELSRSRSVRTSTPPQHVCHRSSLCVPPPRHGRLEEHRQARHLRPHPHLLRQAGHRLCCQVRWSCHCWSRWIRSWNRIRLWIPDHWLCQEPISQAAALLLCYFGICFVRGHGSVLFDDGILASLCFLNIKRVQMFILVV